MGYRIMCALVNHEETVKNLTQIVCQVGLGMHALKVDVTAASYHILNINWVRKFCWIFLDLSP